ncbi:endonuclease/exonuclease/phosphatase family protein [Tellurirhabdus bombi]|uniref:endonuclease/exonuclease/phosphatase family protein n=1 Tax=Tellurirhabdus bombi TaxID=2907205 RepID=UPI001F457B1D|nr:endonuclease/exonuclease/phosphatase family protein [Tellurirhabdus bombi]
MKVVFWLVASVARFIGSILWSLNILLFLYTLLVYYLCYYLPLEHWSASMLMISLPIAWGMNVLFLVFWLVTKRPARSVLPLVTLLFGIPFWPRTLGINSASQPLAAQNTLRVMSYNVMSFNEYENKHDDKPDAKTPMQDWVIQEPSDVKCFQEFFNHKNIPSWDIIQRLEKAGYPHRVLLHAPENQREDGFIGVALFSRYPIVKHGELSFEGENNGFNGLVWADIVAHTDTVRVFSVHMESMGIRVGKLLKKKDATVVRAETKGILRKLRDGFILRRDQIHILENFVRESPYPVIVGGDFNDTPYSVTYGRLRQLLHNAFEDAGRGFGFSYHKPPGFIRIDNQFYDDSSLKAINYTTVDSVKYSDHYPIVAEYVLNQDQP